MTPTKITDATHVFRAPPGWDVETYGECSDLQVRKLTGDICQSAWRPSKEELAILNAGGTVILSIWGGQPPVAIGVEP